MNDDRLEIIPFGRTLEESDKLDAKKEAGQRGLKLFFLQIALVFLAILAICLWK